MRSKKKKKKIGDAHRRYRKWSRYTRFIALLYTVCGKKKTEELELAHYMREKVKRETMRVDEIIIFELSNWSLFMSKF